MGQTGETFIVGPDDLMRSNSRMFVEDYETYERDVVEAGTPPDVAQDAIRQHGTTLVQPVATEATKLAQQGQRGTLQEATPGRHRFCPAYHAAIAAISASVKPFGCDPSPSPGAVWYGRPASPS